MRPPWEHLTSRIRDYLPMSKSTERFVVERSSRGWLVVEILPDWPHRHTKRMCPTKRMATAIASALNVGDLTREQAELIVADDVNRAKRRGIPRPHTHAFDMVEIVFDGQITAPTWWKDFRSEMVARDTKEAGDD